MALVTKIFFACVIALTNFEQVSYAAYNVPLQLNNDHWQKLEYRDIKPNIVSQLDDGILISIEASASPLIYVLDTPREVVSLNIKGSVSNLPLIPSGVEQGDEGADDFALRLGLVIQGNKTLGFAKRLIAARWVKTLFDLAPPGTGIDHINFLSFSNPKPISWQLRELNDSRGLFKHTIVTQLMPNSPFDFDYTLTQPVTILALWISSDGDDTGSNFELILRSISLKDTSINS